MEYIKIDSLYNFIERAKKLFPNEDAFRFNNSLGEQVVTYSEFFDYTYGLALAFRKMGVKDNKVIIIGGTSVEWIAAYTATIVCGGVAVPLDPYLVPEEIINFTKRAGASFIVHDSHLGNFFKEEQNNLPKIKNFIAIDKEQFSLNSDDTFEDLKFMSINKIVSLGNYLRTSNFTIDTKRDPSSMAALLFTSGTTGSSKGVMLSEKNICMVLSGLSTILYDLTPNDRLLSVLPAYHTYELNCGILGPMLFGSCVCISDGVKYVAKNMKQFSPTLMMLVPLFAAQLYKNIIRSIKKQGKEKFFSFGLNLSKSLKLMHIDIRKKIFAQVHEAFGGKLKYFIVGGAALSPEIAKNFRDLGITVSQGYGITECAPLISCVDLHEYNPESCGKLLKGMQIYIDKENPKDDYGEIVVKGDNVMLGYYEDEEETKKVLSDSGWFRTGDYGYIDNKGYIYITGRKKNVIVSQGGKNIFPEEIEEYINKIPLVEESAVIGRQNDKSGDVDIVAIVYPNFEECKNAGFENDKDIYNTINEKILEINKRLVSYKQIHKLELRFEPFEKTSTKKIKRHLI